MRATDRAGASFEKVFVISVTDVGSVPVANQDFTPTRPFVAVGNGESAALDLLANDSGEGGGSLVVAAVTQGINGGTVVSTGNNVNYTAPADYTGPDSFTYTIRDSASGVESNSATVHLYVVANDAPGDCNSDQHVDAADVAAIVYESLDDADPNAWWAIYSGDFLGSPLGCDANGSKNGADGLASSVTASDLSCAVYIFFGKPENCAALTGADAHANAILRFESGVSGQTGSEIAVGVELLAGENQVAVATFAITYDSTVLTFDPTDADSDGIPDALNLALPADMSAIVIPDVANERILVAVFGTALPLPTLEDDTLATVSFTIKGSVAQKNTALNFSQVTLGSDEATDVGVTTESTMITVIDGQTLLNELFLPFIAR